MCKVLLSGLLLVLVPAPASADEKITFPFRDGDRVAWIGSSSTNIGVWPRTMEFLLRTRHPELKLTFKKHSTGGGTFATGLANIDKWLADSKPTLVFFNYGTNDAGAGEKGLPAMKDNLVKCVAKAKDAGARVMLMTPQSADTRKSGATAAQRRELYAEALLTFAKEKSWPIIDVFHPLDDLQKKGQKDDDAYTILRDTIHLTDPAYIAWAYYLYEGLAPPSCESMAALSADGKVTTAKRCKIVDVEKGEGEGKLAFTRLDEVLPLLPPGPLPPRQHVPLEKLSPYMLQVTGLAAGKYEVRCEGKTLGVTDAAALARGINLNALVLDSKSAPPWSELVGQLWAGKGLEQIGKTRWRFTISRAG